MAQILQSLSYKECSTILSKLITFGHLSWACAIGTVQSGDMNLIILKVVSLPKAKLSLFILRK